MLAFHLANGTTPNSSDWAWPGVPYASSDPGDTVYRGSAKGNVTGSGDGVGVIELDKIGGLGLGWLALWKYHGGGGTRREFLHAAAHGARVLARNINAKPTATISPWPFRAFAQSGKTRVSPTGGLGELYTAHVIWNIQLLDAVLAIPGALSEADVADTKRARSVAWEWLVEFPLRNNNWCGYCEDLTIAGSRLVRRCHWMRQLQRLSLVPVQWVERLRMRLRQHHFSHVCAISDGSARGGRDRAAEWWSRHGHAGGMGGGRAEDAQLG
jgi:hypothetical protein